MVGRHDIADLRRWYGLSRIVGILVFALECLSGALSGRWVVRNSWLSYGTLIGACCGWFSRFAGSTAAVKFKPTDYEHSRVH